MRQRGVVIIGLLSLAVACWPGRNTSGKTTPAWRAMLTYNVLATLYLLSLGIRGEWGGPLLWPAVAMHGVLSFLLRRQSRSEGNRKQLVW